MSISLSVRATRMAISPRLAIRTFWNTAAQFIYLGGERESGGPSPDTARYGSLLSVWRGASRLPLPGQIGCAAMLIELQSHSTVSDGQLPPAEVVEKAAEAGVTTLALTD